MLTLGDIILQYRTEHAMSQRKFSEISGLSNGYISMLEKNQTPRGDEPAPTIDTYRKVSGALGIDIDALIRMVDGQIALNNSIPMAENIIPIPETYRIPLIGTIACGSPILATENIEDEIDIPENINADFALRCKGDSMVGADIQDGDIVYIKQMPEVLDGQIAAVLIEEEATLKRVYYDREAGEIQLVAENPRVRTLVYRGEALEHIKILGRAVGLTRKLV